MATPMPEQGASRKEKALSFLKLASTGQVDQAYGGAYLTEGFLHHNPRYPGEADALAKAMKQNADEHPHGVYEIQRALEDAHTQLIRKSRSLPRFTSSASRTAESPSCGMLSPPSLKIPRTRTELSN